MEITGDPKNAFLQDFPVIPDGTMAKAILHDIDILEKNNPSYGYQKFIQITWKINDGDFFGREVRQKIKVFNGKPEQIDRALNMLKLVMNLCNHRFSHDGEPSVQDLKGMIGKICGVKIKEWSFPKEDGSGLFTDINYVSEVHQAQGFNSEVGVKKVRVESAFSRNAERGEKFDSDIPF
jgi:hypothetical protein